MREGRFRPTAVAGRIREALDLGFYFWFIICQTIRPTACLTESFGQGVSRAGFELSDEFIVIKQCNFVAKEYFRLNKTFKRLTNNLKICQIKS